MKLDDLKENIKYIRRYKNEVTWTADSAANYNTALEKIINIATLVLEAQSVMPKEREKSKEPNESTDFSEILYLTEKKGFNIGYNLSLHDCILIHAKKMMEKDSTTKRLKRMIEDTELQRDVVAKENKDLLQEIKEANEKIKVLCSDDEKEDCASYCVEIKLLRKENSALKEKVERAKEACQESINAFAYCSGYFKEAQQTTYQLAKDKLCQFLEGVREMMIENILLFIGFSFLIIGIFKEHNYEHLFFISLICFLITALISIAKLQWWR